MVIQPVGAPGISTTRPAPDAALQARVKAAADAKLLRAKAAIEVLKQNGLGETAERKAIARKKIEQLKARLKLLQAMAPLDPRSAARIAAQLARELGAAVKDYAAAGGPLDPSDGAAPAAVASTETQPPLAADFQASPDEQNPGSGSAEPPAGEPEVPDAAEALPNPYQAAVDGLKRQAAQIVRSGEENRADSDFLSEARLLALQIKQVIRGACDNAPAAEDRPSMEGAREANSAVAAMDRAVEEGGRALGGSAFSILA